MLRPSKKIFIFVSALGLKTWGAQIILASNADVANTWNRQVAASADTVKAPQPVVKAAEDGSYKVEWTNDVSAHVYVNDITNATGAINTPNQSGTFYRAEYQTDVRRTYENEDVDFFQFGLTHSKDPAVISSTQNQINNIQFGRSTSDYYISGGDVAPKFSSLSSSLAARGFIGQKAFSDYIATAYAGVIADSWEAIANSVPRSQYLRHAFGLKIEKEVVAGLNLYVTGQSGKDQANTITDPTVVPGSVNAKSITTTTFGFEYKNQSEFQVTGELATSNATIETLPEQKGKAGIIDASWGLGSVTLQAGYHDIDQTYNSLSSQATPGIQESNVGIDWRATSWVKLGATGRQSHSVAPAVGLTPAQDQLTNAVTTSANFTINPQWSLNLQRNNSDTEDRVAVTKSKNAQSVAGVKFKGAVWQAAANGSLEELRNQNATSLDSDTTKTKFSVGRSFSNASEAGNDASWLIDVSADYSVQNQKLVVSGASTVTTTRSLVVGSQFLDIANVDITLSDSAITRPNNAVELKSFNREISASHEFLNKSVAKLYTRSSETNRGDATLFVAEQVTGAQYNFSF